MLVRPFHRTGGRRARRVGEVLAAEIYEGADSGDALSEPPKSAEAEALENLGGSAVMRALDDLPDGFREAIYLADIEGYRYCEIAEMMGTPLGTVMSRIHRGRSMLRQRLRGDAPRSGPPADPARLTAPGCGPEGTASSANDAPTPPVADARM